MKPGKKGLSRLTDATGYSVAGLRSAFANEAAFRQELALVAVLGVASFALARTLTEWLILIIPLLVLLITELLNSAIENVVDRVGDEPHILSGRAKDQGSAAVFIALVLIAVTWGSIAWSRFHAIWLS